MKEKESKNLCVLHGWGANTQKLEPLKEELENLGWTVLLPKLPFFELPEPQNPWGLKDFTRFIDGGAKKFFQNESYTLFGHSLGGRIAIKMASEKDIPPQLNSLILCAAAGISRTNIIKRFLFKMMAKAFNPLKNASPTKYTILKKIVYRLVRASDYEKITSEIKKETFRNIIEENLKSQAVQIKIPTFILWGEQDKTTPISDAYFLQKNIAKSILKVFPDENHRLPYNQPKKIALEIDHWFKSL